MLKRKKITSSNIRWYRYDAKRSTLWVKFHNQGRIYLYFNVPEHIHRGLVMAESPGKYFQANIVRKFGFIQFHQKATRAGDNDTSKHIMDGA